MADFEMMEDEEQVDAEALAMVVDEVREVSEEVPREASPAKAVSEEKVKEPEVVEEMPAVVS